MTTHENFIYSRKVKRQPTQKYYFCSNCGMTIREEEIETHEEICEENKAE